MAAPRLTANVGQRTEKGTLVTRAIKDAADADYSDVLEIQADNAKEIAAALNKAVAKALEEIGLPAEGYAKEACPVDTGRLHNSITHATSQAHARHFKRIYRDRFRKTVPRRHFRRSPGAISETAALRRAPRTTMGRTMGKGHSQQHRPTNTRTDYLRDPSSRWRRFSRCSSSISRANSSILRSPSLWMPNSVRPLEMRGRSSPFI